MIIQSNGDDNDDSNNHNDSDIDNDNYNKNMIMIKISKTVRYINEQNKTGEKLCDTIWLNIFLTFILKFPSCNHCSVM